MHTLAMRLACMQSLGPMACCVQPANTPCSWEKARSVFTPQHKTCKTTLRSHKRLTLSSGSTETTGKTVLTPHPGVPTLSPGPTPGESGVGFACCPSASPFVPQTGPPLLRFHARCAVGSTISVSSPRAFFSLCRVSAAPALICDGSLSANIEYVWCFCVCLCVGCFYVLRVAGQENVT